MQLTIYAIQRGSEPVLYVLDLPNQDGTVTHRIIQTVGVTPCSLVTMAVPGGVPARLWVPLEPELPMFLDPLGDDDYQTLLEGY
jgi:hypothetical protein